MFSAAFLDIFLSAAMLLTTGSALATLCRRAIQLDSSYESHVAAAASFETSAMGVALTRTADPSASSSGDSSVNLFVRDRLRQSGARFCHLHSQRPPIRA